MARGSIYAFIWRFTGTVLSLALVILLTRTLAPGSVGAFFLVMTVATVASTVAQFGLPQVVTRLVAGAMGSGQVGRARSVIRRSIVVLLAVSGAVAVALATVGFRFLAVRLFQSTAVASVSVVASFWVVLLALERLLADGNRAFHHIGRATLMERVLSTGLLVIGLFVGWRVSGRLSLEQVVVLAVTATGVAVIMGSIWLARLFNGLRGEGSVPNRVLLKIGIPIMVSNVLFVAFSQADLWILGARATASDVALYGTAARVAAVVGFPHLIMIAVMPPIMAQLHARGELSKLQMASQGAATAAGAVAMGIAAVVFIGGSQLLALIFGGFYAQAVDVLFALAVGQLVNVLGGPNGMILIMTGHEKVFAVIQGIFVPVTIGAGLYGVGVAGALGLAIAMSLGLILRNVVTLIVAHRLVGVWTHFSIALLPPLLELGKLLLPHRRG